MKSSPQVGLCWAVHQVIARRKTGAVFFSHYRSSRSREIDPVAKLREDAQETQNRTAIPAKVSGRK
jgi:hypothetical protein